MTKISIITTCFGREDILKTSLESLFNSDLPWEDISLTYVDDATPNDAVINLLKEFKPRATCDFSIIKLPKNSASGPAANAGVKFVTDRYDPEFLMITDSDIIYKKKWLQHLLDVYYYLENHVINIEQFQSVNVATYAWSKNTQRTLNRNMRCRVVGGYNSVYHPHCMYIDLGGFSGAGIKTTNGMCNWLMKTETMKEIGEFSRIDPDWKWVDKLYSHGYFIANTIPSVVQHIGHSGTHHFKKNRNLEFAADFVEQI